MLHAERQWLPTQPGFLLLASIIAGIELGIFRSEAACHTGCRLHAARRGTTRLHSGAQRTRPALH
jgi:hypothetical protein